MKLASYTVDGRASYGVVTETGIVDLGRRIGQRFPDLRAAIAAGALPELARAASGAGADYKREGVRYLPTIPQPDKVLCIGYNYKLHVEETGQKLPQFPSVFLRLMSSLVGHEAEITAPAISGDFDYEGELAVVIGTGGRHIAASDALRHVAGYTCMDDGSVRDWQQQNLIAGKNFPRSGAMGPWMTTADEIPDPTRLTLVTRVNGEKRQRSGTDMLIFPIPTLIAYCSSFTRLEPGDVISTGTPAGVAWRRSPPAWLKPGDRLEIEISGIGVLRNRVVAEGAVG